MAIYLTPPGNAAALTFSTLDAELVASAAIHPHRYPKPPILTYFLSLPILHIRIQLQRKAAP
jgi:hypothetical protein